MEKFDKVQFDIRKTGVEYQFTSKNGNIVRQMENISRREYSEEIKDPITPYSMVNVYYFDSGNIKIRGEKFYNTPINTWEYYDTAGNVTKKTNWELPFQFTLKQLAQKMQTQKVDIMDKTSGADVLRNNKEKPLYIVVYPVGSDHPYDVYTVTIDGITGMTLDSMVSSVKH